MSRFVITSRWIAAACVVGFGTGCPPAVFLEVIEPASVDSLRFSVTTRPGGAGPAALVKGDSYLTYRIAYASTLDSILRPRVAAFVAQTLDLVSLVPRGSR